MDTELRNTLRFLQNENLRLKEENQTLRQSITELHNMLDALRKLQEVSTAIDAQTDVRMLLDRILRSALNSIGANDGSLLLLDKETEELVFVVVHGEARESLAGYRIPSGTGIAGWVAQHAKPAVVPDAQLDPRFSFEVDQALQFQTRSMVCVPIVYEGDVLGVIQALNKRHGEKFNKPALSLLGVVAQLAATAINKAEMVFMAAEQA